MEKVSAMKKVALFLMIVGLAVAMVACQGAVGPKGDPGDPGDTGDTGAQGPQGPPGAAALTLRQGVNLIVSINDGEDQGGTATVGDDAVTRDMSSFFAGGTAGVKYSASAPETFDADGPDETAMDEADNQVEVSDDEMTVTITLKEGATQYDPALGYPVVITATDDSQGIMHTQTLKVVRNMAPASGTGTAVIPNLLIGALGAETPEDSAWPGGEIYTCAMLNSCEFTPIVTSSTDADATDSHFHDFGDLTYEVVSSDMAKVEVMGGKTITIIGKASTAVTPEGGQLSNTFADQGVTITVTAVDGGTRKSESKSFMVIVNAPPARNDTPVPSYTITESGANGGKTLDVALLVTDSDTATGDIRYTIRDNDGTHPHVTATIAGSVLTLTATTNGTNGDRTVTVRVSEAAATASSEDGSVDQYLDIPITVTNSSN